MFRFFGFLLGTFGRGDGNFWVGCAQGLGGVGCWAWTLAADYSVDLDIVVSFSDLFMLMDPCVEDFLECENRISVPKPSKGACLTELDFFDPCLEVQALLY